MSTRMFEAIAFEARVRHVALTTVASEIAARAQRHELTAPERFCFGAGDETVARDCSQLVRELR